MAHKQIKTLIKGGNYYLMGDERKTDFCVNPIGKIITHTEAGGVEESIRAEIVRADGSRQTLTLSGAEISSGKWARQSGLILMGAGNTHLMKQVGELLIREASESGLPTVTEYCPCGWFYHPVRGTIYTLENGSISADGFLSTICSQSGGCFSEAIVSGKPPDMKQTLHDFLEIARVNPSIFLPMLFTAISGLLQWHYETTLGIPLYLLGSKGSGKTELACEFSNAMLQDRKAVIPVNSSPSIIIGQLTDCRGVRVLDDVTTSRSQSRREHTASGTATVIRSIALRHIDAPNTRCKNLENIISLSAFITGEVLPQIPSEQDRCLILDADGFLKDGKNSLALEKIQRTNMLAAIYSDFITWTSRKSTGGDLDPIEITRKHNPGISSRIQDNIERLRISANIFLRFMDDNGICGNDIAWYEWQRDEALHKLMLNTALQINGLDIFYLEIVLNAIRNLPMIWLSRSDFSSSASWSEALLLTGNEAVYIEDVSCATDLNANAGGIENDSALVLPLDLFRDEIERSLNGLHRESKRFDGIDHVSMEALIRCGILGYWKKSTKKHRSAKMLPAISFLKEETPSDWDDPYSIYKQTTILAVCLNANIRQIKEAVISHSRKHDSWFINNYHIYGEDHDAMMNIRKKYFDYVNYMKT